MARRFLVGVAACVVLVCTACGAGDSTEPANPSSATGANGSTAQAAPTTSLQPERPTHGLLIATEEAGVVEIGMVDPEDGTYAIENTFDVGDFAKGPNAPSVANGLEFRKLVAPDRTRVMVQREVNGDFHTGWVTADGDFVDVTAGVLPAPTDFSGDASLSGLGFDGNGSFYYRLENNDATEVWSLPPGATTGQTLVHTTDLLTRYLFDYDGSLQFSPEDSCANITAYSWLGDTYLHSDGTQIYRTPRMSGGVGSCGGGQPLLPNTNTARVDSPVPSPDGTKIAFVYVNDDDSRSIYIINADGSGQPQKIESVEWPSADAGLVGWV